jgi:Lysyl oxidase
MLTRGRLAIAVAVIFVPVLWLAATATGGKAPTGGTPLYPDMQSAVPHHFTVQNDKQHEWIRFSNLIANTGQGGLRLRPEHNLQTNISTGFQEVMDANGNIVIDKAVSEFVFHPQHNHWHMQAVATFEIRTALDDGTRGRMGSVWAGQSQKTSFCLIDVIKLEGNSNTTDRTYWDCFPDEHQGISAGWGDQYHHELAGQELEITGAPSGVYYMLSIANPEGRYLETTTDNNTAWSSFRITRDSMGNAKITEISHSPCSGTLCGEDIPNR